MDVSNLRKMTKEQYELFDHLRKDREENAKVLEKTSMKGVKKSVTEKYSEQAHFIYELLQNADDAKATKARFVLYENGLIFAHNGKIHFSISDPKTEKEDKEKCKLGHINSITSIGNTAKFESEIGKFGIGFKSVFQYTNTPHVYDPPFKFKIERFIVPVLLESDYPERVDNETLFYFPFGTEKMTLEKADEEINTRLQKLDNPLLFLRYLKEIKWENKEGKSGIYFKKVKPKKAGKIVTLISKANCQNSKKRFLIFDNKIADPNNTKIEHNISIAYSLAVGRKIGISSDHKFPAYCFFATRESTELKFIIQAPFLLTDSREGIKQGENWNEHLIEQTAYLIAESLPKIKDLGLLNIDFLNALPISREDFQDEHMFRPVFDSVLNKFKTGEKLLPENIGGHISSKQAILPKDKELIGLLETKQLSLLELLSIRV